MAYGGEIYGSNAPSPYQVMMQQHNMDMQERRYNNELKREQQRNNAKVANAINVAFDRNHLTTGTSADPIINAMISQLIGKYTKMYSDSKGSLDAADMTLAMQGDMMAVKAYHDNVNVIKSNAMKAAQDTSKQYPGFSSQELYQKAMDRGLYKDGRVITNLEDFDLQHNFVDDVIDKDYGSLNIGNKGMLDSLQKLPSEDFGREIVTRDKAGREVKYRGTARFFPKYQDLTYDKETGEPKIGLQTIPVNTPDGKPYMDKVSGKPVEVIDENAFTDLMQNRQLGARINQLADQRIAEMSNKGIAVDDADKNIIRRQVATDQLDGVFRNKSFFSSSDKMVLPRNHKYKVGSASELSPFNLEAAPVDGDGNRNLTGQVGGFIISDPLSRGGSTNAEMFYTKKGGLLLRAYNVDEYGNRTTPKPDRVYYGQDARNIIEANVGWPGNNKKDLYKARDLFKDKENYNPMDGLPKADWNTPVAPSVENPAKPTETKTTAPAKSTKKTSAKKQTGKYD